VNRRDFVALLGLAVVVVAFVAYEMAGLLLPGWHTISYYASISPGLGHAIEAGFIVAGGGGAVWFYFHLRGRIPK
jgi:hypothetical protein